MEKFVIYTLMYIVGVHYYGYSAQRIWVGVVLSFIFYCAPLQSFFSDVKLNIIIFFITHHIQLFHHIPLKKTLSQALSPIL
jgi:hypothetical protein